MCDKIMKKSAITILLFLLLVLTPAFSAQRIIIDSPEIIDNGLYISYQIHDLLDEKSIEALQRGIKSEIIHHIQLWRNKNIINSLEKEFPHPIKVDWDNWEKKYRIESEDEKRLTANIETVKQKCSVIDKLFVADLSTLEKNEIYYISVQVDFQLISAESFNAISDIFSGGKKKSESTKKSGIVSMFVNLVGLGDKEFTDKTRDFIITNAGQIKFVN